ncbi:Dihydrolipoyllysine-residue acetyltransferase component of pyruvate dehydrogenase complex [Buchnera aphidicola (Tetraneura ulmi)]|uniref:2-oxo acid dehydrogenase subunit E2 n=1 Tax=Buchnera aphidicola TaxID=9 RepID=UPI0034641933
MDITEIKIPDIGSESVEVTEILVNVGDRIKKEDSLLVVEGQKTSMEIPSPVSGIINKINVNIGDMVKTSTLVMFIEVECVNNNKKQLKEKYIDFFEMSKNKDTFLKKKKDTLNIFEKKNIYTSPIVRRLARINDIDLSKIKGTGPKNRILKSDLLKIILEREKGLIASQVDQTKKINNFNFSNLDFNKIKISKIQKNININLLNSWKNIPHVTQFDEVDVTELEDFRKKYNLKSINKEKKITILSFIVKTLFISLKEFPLLNSSLSEDGDYIFLKKKINIGIAVDTDNGLVVPVLKNLKNKNIVEISEEIVNFSKNSKLGKLLFSDLQDGTFTVTSLGSIGGTAFTPIINPPEVGILGLSRCIIKPIWNHDKFIPRVILPFSLSYDHQIINGAYACRFTNFFKKNINDIRFLLM